jgi:hypothetical protein
MSGPNTDGADDAFVVAPREEQPHQSKALPEGGSEQTDAERRYMLQHHVANPGDPPVRRPPRGRAGPIPGPDFTGAPGRVAIVQGQVYLVGVILVTQLVLCTLALYELLSGRTDRLWWIAGISLVGFLIALLVALWPRRRTVSY